MPKKTLYHIIEWSVALAACAFLIYKIATYGDYPAMGETLRAMSWPQWLAIVLCIALMPVNMAIEAWRWKTLLPMPFIEAQRQVYYSKLAGLITPWRLGEYPARGVLMSEGEPDIWSKVLSMGVVGSATMTAAIVLAGSVALAFSPAVLPYLGGSYLYALAAVVLLLAIAFAMMPKALRRFAEVNPSLLLRSLAQSLVRLLCWCVQLALVLYALGAITNYKLQITNLLVYYLLVTITPNVPVAEVGIRGAWAIVLFGSMNAAMAGVMLWIINTLLPCLIWPFLRKNTK